MKKIFALLLTSALCLSMVACSSDQTDESSDASSSQTAEDITQDDDNSVDSSSETENTEKVQEIVFEEIVVVDNEECIIKITDIEPDSMWGYTLKVYLENKSADKTYMYSVESAAINGVQADPLFAVDVAAGKKANGEINFAASELESVGIDEFTDIELTFRAYDYDDWMADPVATETIHVYPLGEENATQFTRESQSTDTVLIDNDYVTVIVTGYEDDSIWGYTANLFLVNKSDKNVMFSVDEASVNGYMADPFFANSVSAGKCAFSSMSWSDTTLEENSITEIEEIELIFRAYNDDDFMSDDFANETITLVP